MPYPGAYGSMDAMDAVFDDQRILGSVLTADDLERLEVDVRRRLPTRNILGRDDGFHRHDAPESRRGQVVSDLRVTPARCNRSGQHRACFAHQVGGTLNRVWWKIEGLYRDRGGG